MPVALLTLVVAVAAIGLTATFRVALGDRVAAGVQVLGIDVGGLSRAQSLALIEDKIARLGGQTVTLRAVDQEWVSSAQELGREWDIEAMAREAYGVGRLGHPVEQAIGQWDAFFFGQEVAPPTPLFDLDRQYAELSAIGAQVDRPARDAYVELVPTLAGISVQIVPERPGVRLLIDESAQLVQSVLSAPAPNSPVFVDLAIEAEEPAITSVDLRGLRDQAERILAAPLTLTFRDKRWALSVDEIARMLAFERTSAQSVQLSVEPQALNARLLQIASEIDQPVVNARFEWIGDRNLRLVRESQEGQRLDIETLLARVRVALLAEERVVVVPVVAVAPVVTSADGPKLGITQPIEVGRTSFGGSTPEKAHNIRLASSRLNGVVVPPGATFSFNKEVGPTTLDAGYQTGWGITFSGTGARTIPSVAGGICQVATTLFQAVFHAGYAIEERYPHLYWIQAYGQAPLGMKGLDTTVDEEAGLDFQFINSTRDYVLIQSRVDGSDLVFGLYGVKPAWDVRIEEPIITKVAPANSAVVRQPEPSMPAGRSLQVESAQDGFEVTIVRTVTQGEQVRTLPLRSQYLPSQNVVLYGTGAT